MEALDRLGEITKDSGNLKACLAALRLEAIEAWNQGDQASLNRLSAMEARILKAMGRTIEQKL